jgi:hypothetical protein
MSETRCPFIKPDGDPCAAHPLPNSAFCLFHDPEQAEAQAQARSKGGSTPRRRTRRFPRLLDHVHVAELLGELFIDALNHTDVSDTKRLQALTNLSRALLKAVGTPPTFLIHSDRREPAPDAGHLLRLYPPLATEVEALLAAEPPAAPPPLARNQRIPTTAASDPSDPSPPLARSRMLPTAATPEAPAGVRTPDVLTAAMAGSPSVAALSQRLTEAEQEMEQALNRARTGPQSTRKYWDLLLAAISPPPADPTAQPATELQAATSPHPHPDAAPTAAAADAVASPQPPTPNPQPLNTRTPEPLHPEQAANRCGTGLPGTNEFSEHRQPSSGHHAASPENVAAVPDPARRPSDPPSPYPNDPQPPVTPAGHQVITPSSPPPPGPPGTARPVAGYLSRPPGFDPPW